MFYKESHYYFKFIRKNSYLNFKKGTYVHQQSIIINCISQEVLWSNLLLSNFLEIFFLCKQLQNTALSLQKSINNNYITVGLQGCTEIFPATSIVRGFYCTPMRNKILFSFQIIMAQIRILRSQKPPYRFLAKNPPPKATNIRMFTGTDKPNVTFERQSERVRSLQMLLPLLAR